MGAGGGLVHAVTLFEQLEELLDRDPGVRRAPQGEDLPQQDPERPAGRGQRRAASPQDYR
ncbi:UNVERIFIED_CONTAM: hypothetical protein FKN15_027355 [Acipenser sinensis]